MAAVLDNDIALKACSVVTSDREELVSRELCHVLHIESAAAGNVYRVTYGGIKYGRVPEALMRVKAVHIAAVEQEVLAILHLLFGKQHTQVQ